MDEKLAGALRGEKVSAGSLGVIEAMEGWDRSLSSFWAFRVTKSMRENKNET
ncbi:hypothetical protein [Bartonella sp. MU70NMGDW]|uniref:hypothetical protein n=1 Tax=Bartonella sp. MU70NMGDW TaxID=3243561 RepID=UPI0035D10E0A